MKKILVILGHPDKDSFCSKLKLAYKFGALDAGHYVKIINISDLKFDSILHKGYKVIQELEPDLLEAQEKIKWADHIVIIFPTWWGTFPAIMQGFLERIVLPGFAFKFHKTDPFWDKLLKGKTGHIITTMGAPWPLYHLWWKAPGVNAVRNAFMKFCGISPVRVTMIDGITNPKFNGDKWLKKAKEMGEKGK